MKRVDLFDKKVGSDYVRLCDLGLSPYEARQAVKPVERRWIRLSTMYPDETKHISAVITISL